jgi:hypothetical protein
MSIAAILEPAWYDYLDEYLAAKWSVIARETADGHDLPSIESLQIVKDVSLLAALNPLFWQRLPGPWSTESLPNRVREAVFGRAEPGYRKWFNWAVWELTSELPYNIRLNLDFSSFDPIEIFEEKWVEFERAYGYYVGAVNMVVGDAIAKYTRSFSAAVDDADIMEREEEFGPYGWVDSEARMRWIRRRAARSMQSFFSVPENIIKASFIYKRFWNTAVKNDIPSINRYSADLCKQIQDLYGSGGLSIEQDMVSEITDTEDPIIG